MTRCEECNLPKETPFLYIYLESNEERKTCKDCWQYLNRQLRIISHGPTVKRHKVRYNAVTVAGKPLSGQLGLF